MSGNPSSRWRIDVGDNREVLPLLPADHFDAVVCDAPYEISFMGRRWDSSGIAYDVDMWKQVLRVLKPGAHLLCFGGTRTFHRVICAIEDAGFEIRDDIGDFFDSSPPMQALWESLTPEQRRLFDRAFPGNGLLAWLFAQGMPKSHNISKAIDREAGAVREVVGIDHARLQQQTAAMGTSSYGNFAGSNGVITAPATDAAKYWDGWGSALSPCYEPIVMARKPFKGTLAGNVQEWGTGGIHIDACRLATSDSLNGGAYSDNRPTGTNQVYGEFARMSPSDFAQPAGRWPPNICLDERAAAMLDAQSGNRPGMSGGGQHHNGYEGGMFGGIDCGHTARGDNGGASRFFFCAKASRNERERGLSAANGERANTHTTVKPLALMRWLCKLVTPPDGLILDPFMGSGTTGMAAMAEGFRFHGIEQSAEYAAIARARIKHYALSEPEEGIGDAAAPLPEPAQGRLF